MSLTGNFDCRSSAYAKELGVAACLPKPFELGELKNLIKRILSDVGFGIDKED